MLFLRTKEKVLTKSSSLLCLLIAFGFSLSTTGGLPLLLFISGFIVTAYSLLSGRSVNDILDQVAAAVGGWKWLFSAFALLAFASLLTHGQPAYALFQGAKTAASNGIGKYIGETESTSLINTLLFAFWALAAVGGLAAVAGGVMQQIQVLVGGLVLFFGMAVLVGVLEFTDKVLFNTAT